MSALLPYTLGTPADVKKGLCESVSKMGDRDQFVPFQVQSVKEKFFQGPGTSGAADHLGSP